MFAGGRPPARRGHIRRGSTTGEVIANATGATVPARSNSPQSSATSPHCSPPAKAEHDPQALLALPLPASPLDSGLTRGSMRPSTSRSSKKGSSVHGNKEEEKNQ
jgi:hypothetical protein